MKIYVRRRHIKAGERFSSKFCPIALAIRDADGKDVVVLSGIVRVDGETSALPSVARQFIRHFDAGKPVKPFAFTIK